MISDFRIAARSLARRPLLSLAVVLTLALGLGANVTVFSVVDSVLLRSLPYPAAERLVALWSTVQRDGTRVDSIERRSFSMPDLVDLESGSESLDQVAAYSGGTFRLTAPGASPERLRGTIADADYLPLLGVTPVLGDNLSDEPLGDSGVPGVLLSHGVWQRRFGGDPGVLGDTLVLDGEPALVVGVLPAGFRGLVDASDIWFPLAALPEDLRQSRSRRWLDSVGRLAEGATLEATQAELHTLFSTLEAEYQDSNQGYGADLAFLSEELVGDVRSPILVLWWAVMAVLLIATANVVNLFVVRWRQRGEEMAVRQALGATPWRLRRVLLAETTLLALVGAGLGIVMAFLSLRFLQPLAPVDLPTLFELGVGVRAIVFVAVLTLLGGPLVGLLAAARGVDGRGSGHRASALGGRRGATHRDPLRTTLLAVEVALATILTIGAGLLVLSFEAMSDVDPGMTRSDVGFLRLDWSEGREPSELAAVRDALLARVEAIAGVERAALARDTPFAQRSSALVLAAEGAAFSPDQPYAGGVRSYYHTVTPDYFHALGIPLTKGRGFDAADTLPYDDESRGPSAPGVAIVTQSLAERVFGADDPVGRRFYLGRPVESSEEAEGRTWFEVVGVVADHRHRDLVPDPEAPADPDVFFSMRQLNPGQAALVVRSQLPTDPLLAQVQAELQQADPRLLVHSPETLANRLRAETARSRFAGALMTAFAALALLLAAIGIYGVVANSVAQQRREIGIRMAIGADRGRVLREVALPAAIMIAVGLSAGVLAALAGGQLLEAQLFEVGTRDLRVFAGSVVALGLVGLAAALIPAGRASRVDPALSLRAE